MAKWFRKTFFIGGKAVEAEVRAGDIIMYDRAGNIVQKFYPYHEETVEYDARGNPVHGRNSLGDDVWLEYDGNGMLVHVKGAITPLNSEKYERWYEYDDAGRLVRKKGYRIGETRYEYDADGNLVHTKRDTSDGETWYEYNADGNLVHAKLAKHGSVIEEWREYDAAGKRVRTKNNFGTETRYEYDADGTLARKRTSRGEEGWYGSDGNIVRRRLPDGDERWYEYDYYDDGAVRKCTEYCTMPHEILRRVSKEKEWDRLCVDAIFELFFPAESVFPGKRSARHDGESE